MAVGIKDKSGMFFNRIPWPDVVVNTTDRVRGWERWKKITVFGGGLLVWGLLSYDASPAPEVPYLPTPTKTADAVGDAAGWTVTRVDSAFDSNGDQQSIPPLTSSPVTTALTAETITPNSGPVIVQQGAATLPPFGETAETVAPLPTIAPTLPPLTTLASAELLPPVTVAPEVSSAAPSAFFVSESEFGVITCNSAEDVTIITKENGQPEYPFNALSRTTGNSDLQNIISPQAEQFFQDIIVKLNDGVPIPTQAGYTFTGPNDCTGYTTID